MSTALTPIETRYAGCRFRSRLEARWAVFFDHLKIAWRYEPQGFTVGPNVTPYLPDFWLPELRLWVEVKGQLEHRELQTLIWAACSAGLPQTPEGKAPLRNIAPIEKRILVLGQVPLPGSAWLHARIDVIGDLVVRQWCWFLPWGNKVLTQPALDPVPLNQFVAGETSEAGFRAASVDGMPFRLGMTEQPRISDAYRAARSARFEHGESGAA